MGGTLTSDPLDVLLKHNAWATRALLEYCRTLTHEQFHQLFEMGPGSLHNTLTHIIGTMRGWTDLLVGREIRLRLEDEQRSIDELVTMLDSFDEELRAAAMAHPADEVLEGEFMQRPYRFTRGAILTHVTTHGMHHRAQVMNMLRQLCANDTPESPESPESPASPDVSVLTWMLAVDPTS